MTRTPAALLLLAAAIAAAPPARRGAGRAPPRNAWSRSAPVGSRSTTAAVSACGVGLKAGGAGPTYGIFVVPGTICPR